MEFYSRVEFYWSFVIIIKSVSESATFRFSYTTLDTQIFSLDIPKYINRLLIGRFAGSIIFCWTNLTALPRDLEEASMIFRVSRDNWTSVFTAPILQYYVKIYNLAPGRHYKVQFFIGPRRSATIYSTLRPFGVSLVKTLSQGKFGLHRLGSLY